MNTSSRNTSNSTPTGWAALLTGVNAIRTLALVGGVALHAINLYIGTTILPSVVRDIGGLEYYAWNTALFVVASIISAAIATQVLGKLGPRFAYVLGAAIFATGSLACALAPSMPVMLAGRVVQGFGGGLLLALPYAMIRLLYDEALWSRAIGLLSGMWGVATLVGPAIGGVFAQMDAWRWAFGALIPAAALFTVLAVCVIPRRNTVQSQSSPVAWAQRWHSAPCWSSSTSAPPTACCPAMPFAPAPWVRSTWRWACWG
ncbi:Major Facilitator Superfamily protein [Polaromonas sp. YR568]|nr:Major Facilitator Superfamily protein [Polaromonas sp. YR568]